MNIIKKISVTNFRCHDHFELVLTDPTTLIIGANGSGKTSILEALHIALRGKSFKSTDPNIIKSDKDSYKIEIHLINQNPRTVTYDLLINKKQFQIDDRKSSRLTPKNRYPIVLFEPTHLNLISGSPSRRRDFLDTLISQIDPLYHQATNKYEKALKQRNTLLKSDSPSRDKLFPWDIILAKYGSEIILKRKFFIDQINQTITQTYNSIADKSDQIHLTYTNTSIDESRFLIELTKKLIHDLATGSTSFGPHRDDIIFHFNSRLAIDTASRGELRSTLIALKFIESELIKNQLNQLPIILLDDIFSELDDNHQCHLVKNFTSHQTLITSTSTPKNMKPTIRL
ncbi:DNA replication and repair protein RecF [Candidatus Saccharibacteria bacterium]|nr:DNA replication and repair protein RecF [Candidatus Saccharibacteria bacterium]